MRLVQRFAVATLVAAVCIDPADAQKTLSAPPAQAEELGKRGSAAKEVLTDATIIAIIIAASIAAYKAAGRPCACPEDLMRNGRRCGANSAYLRVGGARPMCRPEDVKPSMIADYRRTNTLPAGLK